MDDGGAVGSHAGNQCRRSAAHAVGVAAKRDIRHPTAGLGGAVVVAVCDRLWVGDLNKGTGGAGARSAAAARFFPIESKNWPTINSCVDRLRRGGDRYAFYCFP